MVHTYLQFQTSAGEDLQTSDDNSFYVAGTVEEGISLELYKNSAEFNRVDKSEYLSLVDIISGNLREATSILNMDITIEYPKVPDFNYAYISAFGRFYFVTNYVSVTNKMWTIRLEVDTLMSYKDKIYNCIGFVTRNEYTFNENIIDKERVIEQGYDVDIVEVTNGADVAPSQFQNCVALTAFACSTYEKEGS